MVLDPMHPISWSGQLEGGTSVFMAPELLMPSYYGKKDSAPTPESDIYAFGLLMFQVRGKDRGYQLSIFMLCSLRSSRVKPHSVGFRSCYAT